MSKRSGSAEKGRLYYTIGLPSGGKSFLGNQWMHYQDEESLKKCWGKRRPRAVISGDDFRQAIHGHEYLVEAEGFVFATMDIAARALLHRGFDVLMEETATTQSTILRYMKIDAEAIPIWIDTPAEVCKERAIKNGRDFLLGPIDRMSEQLIALKADFPNIIAKLKKYVELRQGNDVAV